MPEWWTLALASGGRHVARRRVSMAACGGRCGRAFRPRGRRFGFWAASCCGQGSSSPDSILSRAVMGTGCWPVSSDLSSRVSS